MAPMFSADGYFLLFLALLLLTLPAAWVISAIFAAAVHELSHYIALRLLGGKVLSLRIGAGGTVMETTPLARRKEALCALAGPVGSLCLLFFARWIPKVAICGAIQGIFNLMPIYPLDGGRLVRCITSRKVSHWVQGSAAAVLLGVGAFWGSFPLIFIAFLCGKAFLRKIPCKEP